jgi:hypothetical protein
VLLEFRCPGRLVHGLEVFRVSAVTVKNFHRRHVTKAADGFSSVEAS